MAQAASGETLLAFLEDAAARYGPRPALLMKPGIRYTGLTYSQLWEGSGKLAALLQDRGLAKGDIAIIWGPNCPQWVLTFFGCIRAGVTLAPLDMMSTGEFVDSVTSKIDPKIAFVSRYTPSEHEQLDVPKILFEELEDLIRDQPDADPMDVDPADLVEIMFTSGTTGDPKGVMLTHRNLMSNVDSISRFIPGSGSDRLLSILPLSHMFEQMGGLLLALRVGANVTYLTSRQPTVIVKTISERRTTMMLLVPQVLSLLMSGIEREIRSQGKERLWDLMMGVGRRLPFGLRRYLFRRVHARFGGALKMIFAGGAPLDPAVAEKWETLGVRVIQGYGATEASPVITTHPVEKPRFDCAGLPIPGVDLRISADGEILVRGSNITPGYWNDPEKTAETFEGEWYKTGDQGHLDGRGYLHLNGRKKDMIVLANGQNVFPEDVEAVLNNHPRVTEAVVVGFTSESAAQVHAVLILEDGARANEVVAWANRQLANHQRIRGHHVWEWGDFPKTHTMKVKKNLVLEAIETDGTPGRGQTHAAPDPSQGRSVESLVSQVSGAPLSLVTPASSLGDDLSLDSLGRVEVLSAIESEMGVYIDEGLVTPETTVAQLSDLVANASGAGRPRTFPTWGMRFWSRMVRGFLQRTLMFPLVLMAYRVRVIGVEHLQEMDGPVLFAANHALHLDNGIIIKAMPSSKRRWLAIAASDHMWSNPFRSAAIPLLGNGFPFSKEENVRASLENLGRILDKGWSVLIYPEGELTEGGPMKPFLGGTGLVAVGGQVPIVPVKLHIQEMGSPTYLPMLRRGEVEIRFGAPMIFPPRSDFDDATRRIEAAVQTL